MAIKKHTTSKQKAASRRNLEKARAAKKRGDGIPSTTRFTEEYGYRRPPKKRPTKAQRLKAAKKNPRYFWYFYSKKHAKKKK